MDMSRSFQAGAAEHFPQATVCFDRFHVVALGSKALDEVRRAEVKSQPELKGTRWSLLKNPSAWTIVIDRRYGATDDRRNGASLKS